MYLELEGYYIEVFMRTKNKWKRILYIMATVSRE